MKLQEIPIHLVNDFDFSAKLMNFYKKAEMLDERNFEKLEELALSLTYGTNVSYSINDHGLSIYVNYPTRH